MFGDRSVSRPRFFSCVVLWDPIALLLCFLGVPFHGQQALRG